MDQKRPAARDRFTTVHINAHTYYYIDYINHLRSRCERVFDGASCSGVPTGGPKSTTKLHTQNDTTQRKQRTPDTQKTHVFFCLVREPRPSPTSGAAAPLRPLAE